MTTDVRSITPWALIAGGSEGVGACFARRLADQGINLFLIARKPGPLEELATEIRGKGVEVRTLQLDLTAPDAIDKVKAATDGLEIGMLIHNAGSIATFGEFVDLPLEISTDSVMINVISQMQFAHHFGKLMKARGKGFIVMLGSMAGNAGCAMTAAYAGAKACSQIFSEGFWFEMRPHGVHVLSLVIGGTNTPALIRNIGEAREGMADPDDVAKEGLDHLLDGPVWVASGYGGAAHHIRKLPRVDAVTMMSEASAPLFKAQIAARAAG